MEFLDISRTRFVRRDRRGGTPMYRAALCLFLASAAVCHAQDGRRPILRPQPPPSLMPPPTVVVPARPFPEVRSQPTKPDVVLAWCDATLNAIKAEKTPPPIAARNLAIVHIAIYDAIC